MILFASALDNEEIPNELVDSCKRIINSKTMALTEQELNNQFESHGLNEVSFLPGYTNVYAGSLIWASSDTPSNHSPFSFAEPSRTNPSHRAKEPPPNPSADPNPRSRDVRQRNQSIE
jgi:hypothetical protein